MNLLMFSRRFRGGPEATETDKLTEVYPVRVPKVTKDMLDALPADVKHMLNDELREMMGLVIHMTKYDPSVYLKSE